MNRPAKFGKTDIVNIFSCAVKHGCSSIKLDASGSIYVRFGEVVRPATNDDFRFSDGESNPDWADEVVKEGVH